MPYSIDRYNGTVLTVVEDGTIDSTTDIKLIGKNYAGYGEVQNENLVHLLENFSGASAPPRPVSGQLWFDSANKKLKFYDATKWRTTGGAEIGASTPTGLSTGDFWFDTANDQLYAYNGTEFVLIGPETAPGLGITQLRSRTVVDNASGNHAIIEAIVDDETIYVISADEFTLDSGINPITGFSVIKKGLTLINTGASGVTSTDHRYWGTATNSLKLGGVDAANFIQSGALNFTGGATFDDVGFTVGNGNDLEVYIDVDGTTGIIKNAQSSTIKFQTTSGTVRTPMTLVGLDILPGATGTSNIGSSSYKYNIVYANSFSGTATQSDTLSVGGVYRSAATSNTANTIAARDASGDLTANQFIGNASTATSATSATTATNANSLLVGATYRAAATTASANTVAARDASGDIYAVVFRGQATSAQYADLAEKYLADADYEIGTVLVVGGDKEVTASNWGQRAIGVVSGNPAYIMNSDLDGGTLVALKGRVPVKVVGTIRKGDRLVASNNGSAVMGASHSSDVFAISLETNNDTGVKLVECVIL
jgi:hypothetical protein